MLKRLVEFPFTFRQVDIASSEEEHRNVIKKRDGRLVLLSDEHFCSGSYFPGVIKVDREDTQCYYADLLVGGGKFRRERFHYHDLAGLMEGRGISIFRYKGKLLPVDSLFPQD